jgi:molecular chaperone DnaK (HSP70)
MTYSIGIDLGTTHTAVSYFSLQNERPADTASDGARHRRSQTPSAQLSLSRSPQ